MTSYVILIYFYIFYERRKNLNKKAMDKNIKIEESKCLWKWNKTMENLSPKEIKIVFKYLEFGTGGMREEWAWELIIWIYIWLEKLLKDFQTI